MHMADALLSPIVGGTMLAVSAVGEGVAVKRLRTEKNSTQTVAMMGVMGAFVFAAQMINYTIPGTGSSGHIGGGILLSAVLGGPAALITITAVLLIQSLFFADGGLLALGCNVFNMGVIPCLFMYPLLFKPMVRRGITAKRLTVASIVAVVVSLQLGAFGVVLQTLLSGITVLPFGAFVLAMQPIHLAIGLVEGAITAAVLCFVQGMEPQLLAHNAPAARVQQKGNTRKVLAALLVCAALTAGGLSLFASAYPDGLEWSMEQVAGTTELEAQSPVHEAAAAVQQSTAFMPDYAYAQDAEHGTSVAGLAGGALTLLLAVGAGGAVMLWKKKKHNG